MKARTLKKDKVNIITMGCSKNLVDSEVLLTQLRGNGIDASHESNSQDNNIVIINTCGFIDNAKQESIDTKLPLKKPIVQTLAMGRITNDRMADVFHMPAQLMSATGQWLELHQGVP